jgi:NAD(P)-dependent dehydrogenase (short-subunit alcohol dehydrogenase family)
MEGRVIAITGGASGMGLESAKLLASKGAKVSLADVQEEPLFKAVEEIKSNGGTAMGCVVDVRNRAQVEEWIQKTVDAFGKLDGAANLAGVIGKHINITPLEQIDDDDWDFVVGVNQKGLLNCLRAQIPHFNDGGSIVNAASVAGIIGFPRNASYVASKHAVVGLTKTAAKELGTRQIRCNCFCPGPYVRAPSGQPTIANGGIGLTLQCSGSLPAFEGPRWISAISL